MNPETIHTLEVAQEAVNRLVEACQKHRPLYKQHPQAVAQVSRTAKWLLSAITGLHRKFATTRPAETQE